MTLLTPQDSLLTTPLDWYGFSKTDPNYPQRMQAEPPSFTPTTHSLPSPTSADIPPELPSPFPAHDELTLEQIRDIVAPTRGFFSRDYSVHLGWNNVSIHGITSAQQTENPSIDAVYYRCCIPSSGIASSHLGHSFVHLWACVRVPAVCDFLSQDLLSFSLRYLIAYSDVCADYAVMVNRGDAMDSDQWRELPIEQQMGFRIPISVVLDLPRLRERGPVITVSEYLRLHGQSPEAESTTGLWPRELYHSNPNVFESNQTKMPSLFVIENHLYDPDNTNRVDYIPQEMKSRGNWTQDTPTNISKLLLERAYERSIVADWGTAKDALRDAELGPEVDLDDDAVVEDILIANGWEVLHTFSHAWVSSHFFYVIRSLILLPLLSISGEELDRTVVTPIKQVTPRWTIRGFKDDYYGVDHDVVLLAGETHAGRKVVSKPLYSPARLIPIEALLHSEGKHALHYRITTR
jgi:hypothetical protein